MAALRAQRRQSEYPLARPSLIRVNTVQRNGHQRSTPFRVLLLVSSWICLDKPKPKAGLIQRDAIDLKVTATYAFRMSIVLPSAFVLGSSSNCRTTRFLDAIAAVTIVIREGSGAAWGPSICEHGF